ncbi:MAG: hypothetical protein JSS31_06670 [Proteobacteria bacterium]|nr:hypothetical protein [Pseudomonadota bacterium]MBS0493634.1 hypothetical protein [Pseudomonadota bacterium]
MEAQFLRLAPARLQEDYLALGAQIHDLAQAFFTLVNQGPRDGTDFWLLNAPSLSHWRTDALHWHHSASALVAQMLQAPDPAAPSEGTAPLPRITRGLVRGRLDGLAPALLLLRPAGNDRGTMLTFAHHPLHHFKQAQGFILPLALCRDAALRDKLQELVRLLRAPLGSALAHRPTLAQQRQSLHTWLADNGLGYLRCVNDPAGVQGWTQWALTPAVFQQVLRHFDYASALYDAALEAAPDAMPETLPETVRIAAQQPFAFANHGALLEWAGLEASDHSTLVFRLFLLDEAPPPIAPATGIDSSRWQRPSTYWATALRNPQTDIRVQLKQPPQAYGVITLFMHLGGSSMEMELLYYHTDLLELLDWLHSQAQHRLPTELTIEEDMEETQLIVHPDPLPEAQASPRLLVAAVRNDFEDEVILAATMVDAQNYFSAWRQAWHDLLAHGLDMPRWHMTTEDNNADATLLTMQQANLQALHEHPFLHPSAHP